MKRQKIQTSVFDSGVKSNVSNFNENSEFFLPPLGSRGGPHETFFFSNENSRKSIGSTTNSIGSVFVTDQANREAQERMSKEQESDFTKGVENLDNATARVYVDSSGPSYAVVNKNHKKAPKTGERYRINDQPDNNQQVKPPISTADHHGNNAISPNFGDTWSKQPCLSGSGMRQEVFLEGTGARLSPDDALPPTLPRRPQMSSLQMKTTLAEADSNSELMGDQHPQSSAVPANTRFRDIPPEIYIRPVYAEDIPENPHGNNTCCEIILVALSYFTIIITFPFSLFMCIKVVQEYERAVIFRLGRLLAGGAKGPGLFFILPCIDNYLKVDMRTVSFDVPPQEVLSKDSVTVAVDAVVYYRIANATASITNVEDANKSTRLLAATTLRNVLGTKSLSEILAERETVSHFMQTSLDEATDPWGVKVERVEIKDVRLPVQLQRAMAAEAEAAREARAKVIAAEGENKASRALKDASDVIQESPAALQLRYLQTLNTISAEKNSTIIFPLPIDFMKSFFNKKR